MLVRLLQATTITIALYTLVGLNTIRVPAADRPVTTPETLVALKQALTRHLL